MALITKPFTFASGALVVASEHNSNFDTIYTEFNGLISNANISPSAAIAYSKLTGVAASGANSDITSLTGLTTPLASTYGGTGNGFTKFTGPSASEKTFTLPNSSSTIVVQGGALGTPSSGTLTSATGLPAASVVAGTFGSGAFTFPNALIYTNNAIAASGNAATVPITAKLNTVTNNSAATLTITMTTTSATDGQMTIVRILDSSAAAQTITWVNTENSTITAPVTSNGSTTLFLTAGFIYNSATSKWRCIAKA